MKNVLILGASSDLAKALSHKYAANGYNIILAGRKVKEIELDSKNLEIRYNIKATAHYFDALTTEEHEAFYEKIKDDLTGVICAIGYLGDQTESQTNFTETEKIINT
ncbi:MAG: SDR family NAD(P)-dependent oxidoreductase, partial [Vampirovibrionia bacterium]